MVGNGVTNWKYDTLPAFIEMGYWHSLIDTTTYDRMKELNCDYSGVEFGNNPTGECLDLLNKFDDAVADLNVYDIFGTCWGLEAEDDSHLNLYHAGEKGIKAIGRQLKSYKKVFTAADYTPWAGALSKRTKGAAGNVQ